MSNVTKFIEAAITNPRHPLYKAGGVGESEAHRHYRLNVMIMEAIAPDRWEKDYPERVAAVQQEITMCEARLKETEDAPDEMATLRQQAAELVAKVDNLTDAVAALTKPAEVPETTETPETVETPEA